MICKICGEDKAGKRKTCLECKTKFPYRPSIHGGEPFNRLKLYYKSKGIKI